MSQVTLRVWAAENMSPQCTKYSVFCWTSQSSCFWYYIYTSDPSRLQYEHVPWTMFIIWVISRCTPTQYAQRMILSLHSTTNTVMHNDNSAMATLLKIVHVWEPLAGNLVLSLLWLTPCLLYSDFSPTLYKWSVWNVQDRDWQIFQKSRSRFKILLVRRVIRSKFHTNDP